jgi:hypothetical protein
LDDEAVRGIAEGQDLIMEIVELQNSTQSDDKSKLEVLANAPMDCDGMSGARTAGYELRLTFDHL